MKSTQVVLATCFHYWAVLLVCMSNRIDFRIRSGFDLGSVKYYGDFCGTIRYGRDQPMLVSYVFTL